MSHCDYRRGTDPGKQGDRSAHPGENEEDAPTRRYVLFSTASGGQVPHYTGLTVQTFIVSNVLG